MLGDLFDSPWKILIIAVVVLVLFGSRKLPDAARSLGRSMRILKSEIRDLHEDDANGTQDGQQPQPQLAAPVAGVPVVPVTTADGVPVAAPAAAAPAAPAAPPPVSVPLPAEVQQDTRPA